MRLSDLKEKLGHIANQYISNAENFQQSSFAFMGYFSNPYGNLPQAKKLKTLCESHQHDQGSFIIALHDIFTGNEKSTHFIPQIIDEIVASGLYVKAIERAQIIKTNIEDCQKHNDGGISIDWQTSDYLDVLKAELPPKATELSPWSKAN